MYQRKVAEKIKKKHILRSVTLLKVVS